MVERTKVLSGFGKDHFDTFDLQFDLQKKYDNLRITREIER